MESNWRFALADLGIQWEGWALAARLLPVTTRSFLIPTPLRNRQIQRTQIGLPAEIMFFSAPSIVAGTLADLAAAGVIEPD